MFITLLLALLPVRQVLTLPVTEVSIIEQVKPFSLHTYQLYLLESGKTWTSARGCRKESGGGVRCLNH